MVDTGSNPPKPIVDMTQWRGQGKAGAPRPIEGEGADIVGGLFSLPFLLERVGHPALQVQMWAAYHLVARMEGECSAFVDRFWETGQEEILESAITLIGKHHLQQYAFPLMRIFKDEHHPLRAVAGAALGRMRHKPAEKLLARWYEQLMQQAGPNGVEVEAAAESLLALDSAAWWPEVLQALDVYRENHTVYSALFAQLAAHATTPERIRQLAGVYGQARGVFNDFHLTQSLERVVGRTSVSRYVQTRLHGGFPLNAVYQESMRVLEVEPEGEEAKGLVQGLGECRNSAWGAGLFLERMESLLPHLGLSPNRLEMVRAFYAGCATWLNDWEEAILKVRETEFHLLVSLPLVLMLEEAERRCLAAPEDAALHITRIYQSPLLSPEFMGHVLRLITEEHGENPPLRFRRPEVMGWIRNEEKDALWKLFTGQLEEVDYPLEQVLPQPWDYALPGVLPRLRDLMLPRLGRYLAEDRVSAVDYTLEILRHAGGPEHLEAVLPHFDVLINHHYHPFMELMTHIPDMRFLRPLQRHYRAGEEDLARLIRFICDVHNLAAPMLEEEQMAEAPVTASVRLGCRGCGGAYQYPVEAIYVNEERIEQRQIPGAEDIYTPTAFACKKCGAPVPFDPDPRFLNDLFAELIAARLMPSQEREGSNVGHIHLIQFPRFEGRPLNPAHFLAEMGRVIAGGEVPGKYNGEILELGRFQMETGDVTGAKESFRRLAAGQARAPYALYYLGVIAFQEKNLYEARVHFSRLIQIAGRDEFEQELDNPVDMAQHYLNLLDKREFKRSHFQLVSTQPRSAGDTPKGSPRDPAKG